MQLQTSRFGTLEVGPDHIITFPKGFVGFPDWRHFALLPHGDVWVLQSADDPDLAFIAVDPRRVMPEYVARVPAPFLADLDIKSSQEAAEATVLALVTVRRGNAEATVNLRAPLVIHATRRLGAQVILDDAAYSIRHPLGRAPSPLEPAGRAVEPVLVSVR